MNQREPLVSVVMPVYNAELYVERAVQSILDQSYAQFELIVIDDGSTDRSWSLIKAFQDERIRCLRNEKNLGYLKTVNIAFLEAKGAFITFQDADDWSAPDRFLLQLAAFEDDLELKICGTQCVFVEGDKESLSSYPVFDPQIRSYVQSGENAVFCGASLMVRSELLTDVGGYDELFDRIGSEDLDWYLRMIAKHKVCNLNKACYYYLQTPGSISRGTHLDPLKYHSAEIAIAMNRCGHIDTSSSRKEFFETEKNRILDHYVSNDSIYRVAGMKQLVLGDIKGYLECGKQMLSTKGHAKHLFPYTIMFVPLFVLSMFSLGRKKKLYRFIKQTKLKIKLRNNGSQR